MESTATTQPHATQFSYIVVDESPVEGVQRDRRLSDEWGEFTRLEANSPDAAKVPPSRFQKRKGSIYATPSSRDGHVDRNYAEKFYARWAEMNRRGSRG
jgi:hypothetical protein